MFHKMHKSHISFIIVLMLLPYVLSADALRPVKPLSLSRSELRNKYGQENTEYNDSRSCNRECNGTKKICYFEFEIENFSAMNSACGDCARGKIEDCFNENCIPANGVERNVMTVNRRIPGPRLNVCFGDEVVVDLTNRMSGANSAIHWHGLHQKETPWSDGVPMVTQCPVHDSNSFRYYFHASQVGTHYWHCHSGIHRFNGCFGKLVVRDTQGNDPLEPLYDYDLEQHQVMITDWSNHLGEDFLPSKRSQPLKVDSVLINGHGTYYNPVDKTRTFAPIAAFYVEPNKRYRWRIDNAASQNCPMEFCVEDHKLQMVAADGAPVEPVEVDCVVSGSGERYDFVLDTSNPEKSEFLIRVRALGFCAANGIQEIARLLVVDDINNITTSPYVDHQPVLDIPPYDKPYTNNITLNHPDTKCGFSSSFCIPDLVPIADSNFEDLRNIDQNEKVERILINFRLNFGSTMPSHFLAFNTVSITGSVNNIITTTPPMPGLTQDDSSIQYCSANQLPSGCNATTLCSCPHLIELKLNKVYDFIFLDGDEPGPTIHPFHLHGYLMQILETGSRDDYENGNPAYRKLTRKAPLKDTIAVPSGGYAIGRFRATNPGLWLMHCHIEYHMHIGMRLIIKVGTKKNMVPPPKNFPVCGNFPA